MLSADSEVAGYVQALLRLTVCDSEEDSGGSKRQREQSFSPPPPKPKSNDNEFSSKRLFRWGGGLD